MDDDIYLSPAVKHAILFRCFFVLLGQDRLFQVFLYTISSMEQVDQCAPKPLLTNLYPIPHGFLLISLTCFCRQCALCLLISCRSFFFVLLYSCIWELPRLVLLPTVWCAKIWGNFLVDLQFQPLTSTQVTSRLLLIGNALLARCGDKAYGWVH